MGNGNRMKNRNMETGGGLRTLRIFGNIRGAAPGYGDSPVHRSHVGECRGGASDRQSGCLEFLSQRYPAAGCTLPVRAEGCHHERLPKRPHARHCPGTPRTSLDPLRAVGAVRTGAAVRAGAVAGLYVDHHPSAHGALPYLGYSHPPSAGEPPHTTHPGRARLPRHRPAGCPPRPRCRCPVLRKGCTSPPAGPRRSRGTGCPSPPGLSRIPRRRHGLP